MALNTGLVLAANFNNNWDDDSLEGNHGTPLGSPSFETADPILGVASADLAGNAYIDYGVDSSLNLTTLTVLMWIRTSKTGIRYLAKKQNEGSPDFNGWNFGINYPSDGEVFATFNGATFPGGSNVNNGNKHLIGFDSTPNPFNIYKDNSTIVNGTAAMSAIPAQPLLLGRLLTTYYNDIVDAFAIWNRILTPSERTEYWNGGAGIELPLVSGIVIPRRRMEGY